MHYRRSSGAIAGLAAALVGASTVQGCTIDEKIEPVSTSASGSGGGAGAGESSAGAGGAGGQGGGGSVTCLDPSASASLFTIADPGFCVAAIYDADADTGLPTWGSHGGPLTVKTGTSAGSVDLQRWKVPAGATGKLAADVTPVDEMIPAGAFAGEQALDLPFFGWTAISWSGAWPASTQGEIVLLKGSSVDKRYPVNGAFALSGIASDAAQGRLLYTGLSAINDAMTNKNALYAADSCGTTAQPDLVPGQDPTCKPPLMIAAWGEASGPVAVDRDGNVFAVMPTYSSGDQEARGFAAAAIMRGQGATDGTPLFTLPGFGSRLSALAPTAQESGIVVFQPFDPMTFKPTDVIAQAYSVSGAAVKPEGLPVTFLKLAKAETTVSLMRDDQDRLWVGASSAVGSTFAVIIRTR
jgi:hypothetical protein